jgi:hypothetical protein
VRFNLTAYILRLNLPYAWENSRFLDMDDEEKIREFKRLGMFPPQRAGYRSIALANVE